MKYFGTDGFRGEANVGLRVDHAYRIGRYLGWYFGLRHGKRAKVIIGKDTRRSSYMLEYALTAGLTASGADAYLMHVITTPGVVYVVRTEDFDCGIMISASHNPFSDNGIKLIDSQGHKMDEILEELETYLDQAEDSLPFAVREQIGCAIDYSAGRNRYVGYLVSTARQSLKGMRIGLDCANGASSALAKSVFDAIGARTYVIHNEPDGLNVNVDCGSTHIEAIQAYVRKEKLDAGFAFDGDADRCIAVDEKGRVVDGDQILYICGSWLKEKGSLAHNTVVATVMSNLGLHRSLAKKGIACEVTPVGDKYVFQRMNQGGYELGGEQSGHVIFGKLSTTGDGILTALRLVEVIVEKKVKFSQLTEDYKIYPQKLQNVRVRDKTKAQKNPALRKKIEELEAGLHGDGRILVRASGTEPLIRLLVEASDMGLCEACMNELLQVMREQGLCEQN